MTAKHRISIVEDDPQARAMLVKLMSRAPGVQLVSHYETPVLALERLPHDAPTVVLMDINLPGMSGVECVHRLKPLLPDTQFLMLTVYEDHDHIFAALAAGATGYLLKDTKREDLLAAVEQISQGGSPMSSGIARKVVQSFSRTTSTGGPLDTLSPREQSVLALLSRGYLYKEIAESLTITIPTVNTHIRRIYEKLQVRSRSQAILKFLQSSPPG